MLGKMNVPNLERRDVKIWLFGIAEEEGTLKAQAEMPKSKVDIKRSDVRRNYTLKDASVI
jgi:hypothetical protein